MGASDTNRMAPLYAAISVFVRFGTGPLTIFGVAAGLNPEEQGIYYVFLSLVALQWVLELGVSTNLVQYLSSSNCEDDKRAAIKLAGIYYFVVAIILILTLLSFVNFVIVDVDRELWFKQWMALVLVVPLNLYSTLLLSVMEGLGNWGKSYFIRLVSSFVYAVVLIVSLYSGLKLWSLSVALILMVATVFLLAGRVIVNYVKNSLCSGLNISKVLDETRSFQMKMMAVWLVGYFYWNALILGSSRLVGLELSGQLGMALTVLTAFAMVGVNIMQSQRALFTRLISERTHASLVHLLLKRVYLALGIYIVGVLSLCLFMYLIELQLWTRFIDMQLLLEMAVVRLLMMLYEFMLLIGRVYGDEPFWKNTLLLYILYFVAVVVSMSYTGDVTLSIRLGMIVHVLFIPVVFINLMQFMRSRHKISIVEVE